MIQTNIKSTKLVETRHEQIYEAAVGLMKEKGFHKTTLRDISRATGISLGNMYDYIKTKDDILKIFHEKATKKINEAIERFEEEDGNPLEKIRRMVEAEFEMKNTHQDLVMLVYQESHNLSKDALRAILQGEERHTAKFKEVIEEGISSGIFRAVNSAAMASCILSVIDGWVLRRWSIRKKVESETMKRHIIEIVLRMLVLLPTEGESSARDPVVMDLAKS